MHLNKETYQVGENLRENYGTKQQNNKLTLHYKEC